MPYKIISQEQIASEIKNNLIINSYNGQSLPYSKLTDRNFEILLYQIFKERIKLMPVDLEKRFDSIELMEAVGEKGRDCILLKDSKITGVIQCKNYNSNISKDVVAKEIIKFGLYWIVDKALVPDFNFFTYYFSVSKGLSGSSKVLLRDFNNEIIKEKKFEKWCEEVIDRHKLFVNLKFNEIKEELLHFFSGLKIERILPEDLDLWLEDLPSVSSLFFKIQTVTDNSLIEKVINDYLTPILESLTDSSATPENNYALNFSKYLKNAFDYYSSARTLVFGNQQKKLEEFYYPLQLIHNHNKKEIIKTKKYPDELLPVYRKVIIIDAGGMGKSTVMKWIFLRAIKENKGVPIFIELRRLTSEHSILNEISNQLSTIEVKVDIDALKVIISKGSFIFFLDGYDEIKVTEKERVTIDLVDFISKSNNNQFILTSRPENAEGIFSDFQGFKIKALTLNEAFELIEKIGNYNERSKKLIQKIKEGDLKSVKEFMSNPLLISLLYKKFEYRESIPFQKQEFYFEVFEALFKAHDIIKGDLYVRPKESGLSFTQFYKMLRHVGYRTVQKNELEYNQTILSNIVEDIKIEVPDLIFDSSLFVDDLVKAVPLFQKEGLVYKWAHKSIQEYFAAEFICTDTKELQVDVLKAIYNSSRLFNLMHVLELCYEIDYKSFRRAILYQLCKDFELHCNATFRNVIERNDIAIGEIRKRQFRTFVADNFLLYSEKIFKDKSQAKTHFSNFPLLNESLKKNEGSKLSFTGRLSEDHYYEASIRKNLKVRRILNLLQKTKNNLISKNFEEDDEDNDFDFKKMGSFRLVNSNLFDSTISEAAIKINDDESSCVNDAKYFKRVSQFIIKSTFNYHECQKIISDIEKMEMEKTANTLIRGF